MNDALALAPIMATLRARVRGAAARRLDGRIQRIRGIVVHATLPGARVGELCHMLDDRRQHRVPAEVIGLEGDHAVLTPIGALAGLAVGDVVVSTGAPLRIAVGRHLLGAVIDAFGNRLDGAAERVEGDAAWAADAARYDIDAQAPPPMHRAVIKDALTLGVRAIDGLLTVARGQRIGIFGAPGVGKSSLLASIIDGADVDVVVLGLIGERGREVRELLDHTLSAPSRARTVAVVATSDRPAVERVKAAYVATSVAEYFRDQGLSVLLLMDSVTRFARAQREIGLAAGEPPTRRGFPPSLFAALPRLLERAGPGERGSITGLYTVLTEGDGATDPVAEEVTSIVDGHIVLSTALARRNHFPAIDVLQSRSRLMDAVTTAAHRQLATAMRAAMATYADIELLLQVGEYKAGTDAAIDAAIAQHPQVEAFLRQPIGERMPMDDTLRRMAAVMKP